jgi:hypothetical protein
MRCVLVVKDVSGYTVGHILKSQAVFVDWLTLNMGPKSYPETSLTTYLQCITSQMSDEPIYAAAKAQNHEW